MREKYDGWAIKYGNGELAVNSFHRLRTDVVKWWNEMLDESLHWRYVKKKYGNKIVKVRLMEAMK